MDHFAFCNEMKEYMKNFFSETLQQINLIIEQRTEELELYLDDAAKKFEKRRKLKKPAVATEVDDEQKSLNLNKKARPSRTANKVAYQKLKDDGQMTAKKEMRHVTDKKGSIKESAFLRNLMMLERISEESDEFDDIFDNRNKDVDKIVQRPSASSQIPCTSSLESIIRQKPTILNGTVVLSDKSSKLDLRLNVGHESNGSDKESEPEKSSKRTITKVKNTDISTDSSSSGALSTVASPQPRRVTRTKTRAVTKAATLYSNTQNIGNQSSIEERMRLLKESVDWLLKKQMEEKKRIKEARKLSFRKRCEQMEFECQEHLRKLEMEEAEALKKQNELEQAERESSSTADNRKRALRIHSQVPFEIITEFVVCDEQTPDLTGIFENIPERALRTTSSAV